MLEENTHQQTVLYEELSEKERQNFASKRRVELSRSLVMHVSTTCTNKKAPPPFLLREALLGFLAQKDVHLGAASALKCHSLVGRRQGNISTFSRHL